MQAIRTEDDMRNFMFRHGDAITDQQGIEIDRIEIDLKVSHYKFRLVDIIFPLIAHAEWHVYFFQKKFPQLRHVDLEAL